MNSKIIKEWLNDICTRTGVSVSGDRTLRDDEVEKIVEYVEELEQALDEIENWLKEKADRNNLNDLLQIIKKAKGE